MKIKLLRIIFMMSKYTFSSILIICALAGVLVASNGNAQKANSVREVLVDIKVINSDISNVLLEIEAKTNFNFAYDKKDLKESDQINLDYQQASVAEVLMAISKMSNLKFKQINNFINISKRKNRDKTSLEIILGQDVDISGKITDENGEGLPGASVIQKGTTNGITTDLNGQYKISLPENATLVISFVGYKTLEVTIGGRSTVDVQMELDAEQLDELVVIGYGTQKKESVTGAVTAMKAEDVERIPVANLSNALAGRISGVFVTQASGAPGYADDIRIRSINTWKDSGTQQPLYVIDGIVRDKRAFNALDYAQVDKITVLKDAASGAIYGARAANGVILVTTKTGKSGDFKLNYNYSYSFDNPSKIPEYMDMKDMVRLENYASAQTGSVFYDDLEVEYFSNNDPARDWYNLAYKDPTLQRHAVSASGGSDNVRYFVGGSFFDQTAFVKNADFKKYNFRSNVNVDFTKNLSGIVNIAYSQGTKTRFAYQEDNDGFGIRNDFGVLWGRLLYYLPTSKPKTDDGKFINPGWIGNPLAFIEEGGTNTWTERNISSLFALTYQIPFLDGLSATAKFSQNYAGTFNKQVELKPTLYNTEKLGSYGRIPTDIVTGSTQSPWPNKERLVKEQIGTTNYQLNLSTNYIKKFGRHGIDAVLVYEQSEGSYDRFYGTREGYPLLQKDQFWATSSSRDDSYVGGSESQTGRASYIGRIAYEYDEKYFMQVTTRRDGSMLFAPGFRWGTFPSVSVGWILSKEDFFKVGSIDFLKLRASWGLAGNDAVGGWEWSESFGVNGDYLFGTSPQNRVQYNGIVNKELTWEKTSEVNIGVDARFLKSIYFSAEYYKRHNYDILDSRVVSVPPSFGGNMPPVNYGIVDAHGFEFELDYTGDIGEVNYGAKANFAYATNKVVLRDVAENVRALDNPNGRPTDYIRMLVATDIIRTQADLDALPANYRIYGRIPELGNLNFQDVSGVEEGVPDGKIDDYDRQVLEGKHSQNPYTFGLNLNANWKGLGVVVFMQGKTGISKTYQDGYGRRFHTGARAPTFWLDSWSEDNIDAAYPKPVGWNQSNDHLESTFWLKSGNYLRLQQVNLTYSLPRFILDKLNISDVTLILTGTNLLTFSAFDYYDPGVYEMWSYPTMKTYTMGIDISF